jgi:hypothetical protein
MAIVERPFSNASTAANPPPVSRTKLWFAVDETGDRSTLECMGRMSPLAGTAEPARHFIIALLTQDRGRSMMTSIISISK